MKEHLKEGYTVLRQDRQTGGFNGLYEVKEVGNVIYIRYEDLEIEKGEVDENEDQ